MEQIINQNTGEVFEKQQLIKAENNAVISEELINIIDDYFMAKQRYDEMIKNNNDVLVEIVKQNGKVSDTGKSIKLQTKFYDFQVTLPTTRDTFDTKLFKQDFPDVYENYKKTSNVKESLKIIEREY